MEVQKEKLRLEKDFIPLHYDIDLDIDIINLSYISKVEIKIKSQKDNPKYLSLNSKSISINSKISNYGLFIQNNSENYIIEHLATAPEDYTNTISSIYFLLKEGIKKDDILIFKCEKNDNIKTTKEGDGLYLSFWEQKLRHLIDRNEFKNNIISSFKDTKNPTLEEINNNLDYFKSLVISLDSSPIALREVIPCFDDPSFKSTFKFSISVHKNFPNSSKHFTIVNNSDIEKIIEKENKKIYVFKITPKMSTYLCTFTIGYYEFREKNTKKINGENLRLRVYGPVGQMDKVYFALNTTEDALKKYEKLFGIPFYMEKLDSIFVPNLHCSAMEFIGCITYKQEIMIDKNNSCAFTYRFSTKTIYHEVCHNWIGNLITMEYFDNTWLNEGIVKFIEIFISMTFGEEGYYNDIMRFSYFYATTWKSHSINNKTINSEESIRKNFDSITYGKAGYIMNMLLLYFGKEKIFNGLKLLINKFKYNNVNEIDFFNCMSESCNYDIKNLLYEWIYEKSFPILNVKFNENKEELIIEQKPNFGEDITFKIPIEIKTKNYLKTILISEKNYYLKLSEYNITYEDINTKNNFIAINSDIKSFCVVNYLDEILKDAIFDFYNDKEKNKMNKYSINDGDVYQIFILYYHIYTNDKMINDIRKLKNIDNYEILYIFYFFYKNLTNESRFFENGINIQFKKKIEFYSELIYKSLDYNNSELIDKILTKIENPINSKKDDESGLIEFEIFYITIICLYKKEEKVIKKIYEFLKDKKFNLYELNKNFRAYLPLILSKFMYLFPEQDKIMIYKSLFDYYEEMYYYNAYFINDNYENALNNLNDGISEDILDFYFDNYNKIYKEDKCKVGSMIIDYFFNYMKKLFDSINNKENSFQDYIYDICVIKNFNIDDTKFKNIYMCYLKYTGQFSSYIDKNKLLKYCDEKYLHLEKFKDQQMVEKLLFALILE